MDLGGDDALELQAQKLAEDALASLPPAHRAAKLAAVKEGILKRLRTQASKGSITHKPSAVTKSAPSVVQPPPPPATFSRASQQSQRPQVTASHDLGTADMSMAFDASFGQVVEACGDELWFADVGLRRKLLEATAAAHAEQKILVGPPADEIRRICPSNDRVLGAGAVLRLGGAHHGGYGEADVKYAYRQLSRALHPDKNPGIPEAPDAFKRLSDAAEELKRSIGEAQRVLQKIAGVFSIDVTPEMLERPQGSLMAEATRLLSAVLLLTGEGVVSSELLARASSAFTAMSAYKGCTAEHLLSQWYEDEELLDLFTGAPLRAAYDCMPKRFRAQFLCALNRAAAAEAARNDSCVRGTWQAVLAQFPEVSLLRDFLDRLRRRVCMPDADSNEAKPGASKPASKWDDDTGATVADAMSPWAKEWRHLICDVIPHHRDGAIPVRGKQLQLLIAALWKDTAGWAMKDGDAQRHLEIFSSGRDSTSGWAFVPAVDILLAVGEGLIGLTAEGCFTEAVPRREKLLTFAAALRRQKRGTEKRGLAAAPPNEPKVKRSKLSKGPTRIVLLTNMVGAGEVDEDLQEETADEAKKYGQLKQCIIREVKGAPDHEAVRIFLEFDKVEAASKAYADMNGRYFDGRVVKARFYDEDRFAKGELEKRAPARIILLTNLVGRNDLDEDLEEETAEEASKFGKVLRCVAREVPGAPDNEAVRLFLEFERAEDAAKAVTDLNGHVFGDREVKVRFYPEDRYLREDFLWSEQPAVTAPPVVDVKKPKSKLLKFI